ncbi:hypothetical protein ACHQM5_024139 [Ranunculus cassubicifolius]
MDSGNSGSIQSSSGGDDEYDPRNESISSFLNSSSGGFLTNSQPHQSQVPPPSSSSHHHHHQNLNPTTPFFFDHPFSNYFNVLSRSTQPTPPQNPNSLQHIGSKNLRSDPNSSDVGAFMSSSTQPVLRDVHYQGNTVPIPIQNPSSISLPHVDGNTNLRPATSPSSSDQPRPSKKRSRASRRAPTTVLTTDTSNFRAMVQEFTGIPAPPFSSASPFPRSRNDLFNNASTIRSSHLEPIRPPPYLLRPFAQKPLSSSHFTPSNMPLASSSNPISSNNFQLLSELGLSKQSQNSVTMQNNSIQSLLQSTLPQKLFIPNSSNTRITPLENLPSFPTSNGMTMRENSIGSSHGDGNQELLGSFQENYSDHQGGSSCKEKGSEQNVSSRGVGEGTVDSWINSAD